MIANKVYIGGQKYKWIDPFAKSDEWKAIENYANSNSLALPTDTIAFDQLIKDLKSAGIWQKLDVFYVFAGDGSNGFKLINWIDTSRHYADAYGGLTWDLDGVKGNGSNGYIDTNFTPSNDGINRQLGDASIMGVVIEIGGILWGAIGGWRDDYRLNLDVKRLDGDFNNSATNNNVGFHAIVRTSASQGFHIYRDSLYTLTSSGNGLTTYVNTINRVNSSYGSAKLSCWASGASLTYSETQSFRTIYNNFLTALGLTPVA